MIVDSGKVSIFAHSFSNGGVRFLKQFVLSQSAGITQLVE